MNWTTQQISREAGFPTTAKFINEASRNEMPFAPQLKRRKLI